MISVYENNLILVYCCVLTFVIGAVLGSFLNCTSWRLVHGEDFLKGRSHCISCNHELGAFDLFPVLSWIFLGGKCRYCKTKISIRYPLTELFFAAMTVLCLLRFDLTVECLRNYIFGCCLFCLSLADLEDMIIPDEALIISTLAYVFLAPFSGLSLREIAMHILSGVVYGGAMLLISLIFDRLLKRESMGGGDIKLLAVTGIYLGFLAGLFSLLLSCILGLIFALIWKNVKREDRPEFPFGPSIAMASWIMLLFGQPFLNWYLGLFGI